MKGISIWWRGSGSVPWRGGDQLAPARPPVWPRAGCFQPFPARRPPGIYIFSSSRGGADSCGANAGSLAGGWLLPVPFYGPSSPRCGLGPAGSAGCSAPGKTLQRLTPGCPVHELGCQMDIPAQTKHGEPWFVATLDVRALSCVPHGCALAVPRSRALGCGGACLKSCFPFSAGAAKALSISSPT